MDVWSGFIRYDTTVRPSEIFTCSNKPSGWDRAEYVRVPPIYIVIIFMSLLTSFPGGLSGRLKGVAGRISLKVNCDDLPPSRVTDYHLYTRSVRHVRRLLFFFFFFWNIVILMESDTTVDQVKSLKWRTTMTYIPMFVIGSRNYYILFVGQRVRYLLNSMCWAARRNRWLGRGGGCVTPRCGCIICNVCGDGGGGDVSFIRDALK